MPTILFVDDDLEIIEATEEIFAKKYPSVRLITARSALYAFFKLPKGINAIDAIFLDGHLFNSYGWDLAAAFRSLGYTCPIYYIGTGEVPEDAWKHFTGKCRKHGESLYETIERHI